VGAKPNPSLAPTIPLQAFSLFQLKFAIITPPIISGAAGTTCQTTGMMITMTATATTNMMTMVMMVVMVVMMVMVMMITTMTTPIDQMISTTGVTMNATKAAIPQG
jgi:hypothetical protein